MKICILGAGGFIGSHMVGHLLSATDYEIVGIDLASNKLEGISGPRFEFMEADIRHDADLIGGVVATSDVAVDLVAYANPSIYIDNPLDVVRLNFTENLRVVEMCVAHGTRLIQYSTSEVYGKPSGDRYREDESDLVMGPITRHRWIYAASKQLLERVIHAYGLRGELSYTIVRPFNFVGPRFDYLVRAGSMGGPRLFAHYMSALLTGGPMYLVNGGGQHRSFTHISDANVAMVTMLEHPGAHNEIFNVGNPGINLTIRGVAGLMRDLWEELTGRSATSELVEVDGETFYGPGYEDVDRVLPDISKLQALGWEPRYDVRTTFRDAMLSYIDSTDPADIR